MDIPEIEKIREAGHYKVEVLSVENDVATIKLTGDGVPLFTSVPIETLKQPKS